jgi:transcriptional activator SPT7
MGRFLKNEENHLRSAQDADDLARDGSQREIGSGKLTDDLDDDDGPLLPDYYDPLATVPELPWGISWYGDSDEVDLQDDDLRLAPRGIFVAPKSELGRRMDANMKQMQDTRKLCSKIAVVKQMQVQTQVCTAPTVTCG